MPSPIRDLTGLQARLSELPPPPAGHGRVYRGQTADYGVMIPSGLRGGTPPRNRLWDMALKPLTDNLSGTASEEVALENVAYWFKVIAQHYGPGSPFLDVTSSPEVALWFGLHRGHENQADRFALFLGDVEFPIECPTLHFTPHDDAPGWLYVLDVPRWDGTSYPSHGELLDLADGPKFVANSPRVRRQKGCLLATDPSERKRDLSSYYACDPIAVARPFGGTPLLERGADHLFPPPDADDCYAQLLRAPLVPQPDADTGYVYGQSLGVYLVTPDAKPEGAATYIERQTRHLQPLVRLAIRNDPQIRDISRVVGAYPEAATYIRLDAPLVASLPPPTMLWNQTLLTTGLMATTEPEEIDTRELFPEVTLTNVLLEFSPLEWAFRESPGDVGFSPRQWRGVWLVRENDYWWMTVFSSLEAGPSRSSELFKIEYRTEEHGFFFVDRDDARSPLLPSPEAKPLFVALTLLRDVSESIKPDPIASWASEGAATLMVRRRTAKLVRSDRDIEDLRLHFVRYLHSDAIYEGPPSLEEALPEAQLSLELSSPFEELRGVEKVYGRAREAVRSGRTVRFSAPDDSGHSRNAVETIRGWCRPLADPERQSSP